ncbi:type II toxin-antitoxin system death-on-curing family toxin [bacterium]|nr:type II toxin-antitoxin system death-on-curing family toxin [bacterium]
MDLTFLSVEEVLTIHMDQIVRYGGDGTLLDRRLLESAVAQPPATFAGNWLCDDLFAMAAAYLYHIVQNHPFVDGNRRTGTVAAIAFLRLNGFELHVGWEKLAEMVLAVASGRIGKAEIAEFLREHSISSG